MDCSENRRVSKTRNPSEKIVVVLNASAVCGSEVYAKNCVNSIFQALCEKLTLEFQSDEYVARSAIVNYITICRLDFVIVIFYAKLKILDYKINFKIQLLHLCVLFDVQRTTNGKSSYFLSFITKA